MCVRNYTVDEKCCVGYNHRVALSLIRAGTVFKYRSVAISVDYNAA